MNTVCAIIGVLFLICVLISWTQGLFKVIISAAGLIASIAIAIYAAPQISGYIEEHTKLDDNMAEYILKELKYSEQGQEASRAAQIALIEELPFPKGLKNNILDNNNTEMYQALDVTGIYDYIAKSVAVVILNAAVFLLLTLSCRIFFFFLGNSMKALCKLPIVKWIDKFGGAIIGIVKGVIYIWVFFLVLSITGTFTWSQDLTAQVMQSDILKLLYDNNMLLDIVGDLTRVLFL